MATYQFEDKSPNIISYAGGGGIQVVEKSRTVRGRRSSSNRGASESLERAKAQEEAQRQAQAQQQAQAQAQAQAEQQRQAKAQAQNERIRTFAQRMRSSAPIRVASSTFRKTQTVASQSARATKNVVGKVALPVGLYLQEKAVSAEKLKQETKAKRAEKKQSTAKGSSGFLTPENVRKPFMKAGELVTDVGEKIANKTSPIFDDQPVGILLRSDVPISKKEVSNVIGTAFLFTAFNPAISTATAQQQSQYADEVVEVNYKGQKVKVLKSQVKKAEQMTRLQAKSSFGRLEPKEQERILRKAFKYTPTGERRVFLDKKSFMKSVEESKSFMRGAGLSEGEIQRRLQSVFPKMKQLSTTKPITIQTKGGAKQVSNIKFAQIKQPISTLNPQAVGQTSWLKTDQEIKQLQNTKQTQQTKQTQNTKQDQNQQLNQKLALDQDTKQETKQDQALKSALRNAQGSLTTSQVNQNTKLDTKTTPDTKTRLKTPQVPKQRPRLQRPVRPARPSRLSEPKQPERNRGGFRLPSLKSVNGKKKKKGIFEVLVRRKGEFRTVGVVKTPQKAVSLGARVTANTLGATFKVKGPGKFRTPTGFRKKSAGVFVEPRNKRLSTGGEIREIKKARRIKL